MTARPSFPLFDDDDDDGDNEDHGGAPAVLSYDRAGRTGPQQNPGLHARARSFHGSSRR